MCFEENSVLVDCKWSRDSLLVREPVSRDRKVASSNPGMSGGRIFFSRVNELCVLTHSVSVQPPCYRSGT